MGSQKVPARFESWAWGATGQGFSGWGVPVRDAVGRCTKMLGAVRGSAPDQRVTGWDEAV